MLDLYIYGIPSVFPKSSFECVDKLRKQVCNKYDTVSNVLTTLLAQGEQILCGSNKGTSYSIRKLKNTIMGTSSKSSFVYENVNNLQLSNEKKHKKYRNKFWDEYLARRRNVRWV